MAGNKVNTKAKGKDEKAKGNSKSIGPSDETEDTDFSLLRKPIQTSITGFAQARKIFDMATEELKSLLSDECDLLYECKVCRNLFRSLANFISHKRVYCQNKFNSTVHGHFIKSSSTLDELLKIKRLEKGYQESLKEINKSVDIDEIEERVPMTKDLTTIIEKIAQNKGTPNCSDKEPHIAIQKIPNSSVAVFQNVEAEEKDSENMKNQVTELDDILSRNIAVLQKDGKFKIESSIPDEVTKSQTEAVIQISDDEDGGTDSLKCKKCDMRFSTQKTLRFHMKYKHVDTRVVYPCPDCLEIFSTSWSVYRHLFKVHRKTAAQIRRLRESIQAKAFKMNNPPAFYEKRKNMKMAQVPKITEEERLDQENQAWMDNMECDAEVPRCGGCGRTFERRAALAAHTHTCQPRSRALRRPESKRIEIQIRKDYNKTPAPLTLTPNTDFNENKMKETKETKEVKDDDKTNLKPSKEPEVEEEVVEPSGVDEEGSRDSGMQLGEDDSTSKSPAESPEKAEDAAPKSEVEAVKPVRLPFAQHAEKSNLMALRQRIIPDIELDKLRCKKCDTRCEHIQELYDHVAKHYNWMRYACKLCNFKHYDFEKLPEHVKVVHKLKGDKDFYFSTVKAIDGAEASELAVEEPMEADEPSPDSRRPSRCSSDSSRLSDDSSSSSTRVEGSRKRKMMNKTPSKAIVKRRRSFKGAKEPDDDWIEKDDTQSNVKTYEDNSSDIDDTYERVSKKRADEFSSVASRRPVRKKAKPKNEDFEYDLSNLLKMEAQGYRDSQTVTTNTKSSQPKKKIQPESVSNYEMLTKECFGALVSLSRKAVENAKAHMKTAATLYIKKDKPSSIFVRPMLPKSLIRGDKLSPKKDSEEEKKNTSSLNLELPKEDMSVNVQKENTEKNIENTERSATSLKQNETSSSDVEANPEKNDATVLSSDATSITQNNDSIDKDKISSTKAKQKKITIPSVLPLKFRRQSLDVIKNNPLINKNISEFTKAGMKTKILVIKPINRQKDGIQAVNTPLKFQTIKLKETNKSVSSEDKSSDQVVVVQVPKVDCITRTLPESSSTKVPSETITVIKTTERTSSTPGDLICHERINPFSEQTESIEITKNGDVPLKKPEPTETESIKLPEVKLKSNEINVPSTTGCDNDSTNCEIINKSDICIASDEPECKQVEVTKPLGENTVLNN